MPLYRFSAGVYGDGCVLGHGLDRDNHLLARHLLFFSSFSLNFRRCWRFSDQVNNDLKSKKCFLIGIRISPGSTGFYRVDTGVYHVLLCSRRDDAGVSRVGTGVYCVGTGVCRALPCLRRVCRVGTVLTPGSAVLMLGSALVTPGWWSSRRPSTFFPRFHPSRPR